MDFQSPQGAQECESVEKSPQERSRRSSEGPELRGENVIVTHAFTQRFRGLESRVLSFDVRTPKPET